MLCRLFVCTSFLVYHIALMAPPKKRTFRKNDVTFKIINNDPDYNKFKTLLSITSHEIRLLRQNQLSERGHVTSDISNKSIPNAILQFDAKTIESALTTISLFRRSTTVVCPLCQTSYARKGIRQHLQAHRKNEDKPHQCKKCGKGFYRPDRCLSHEKICSQKK